MKHTERILSLLQTQEIIRLQELRPLGISPASLYWLYQQGKVVRSGRGTYRLPERDVSEYHSLALACKRTPHGIICLLSALSFHEIGTQLPFEVWMAIDRKARLPVVDYPSMRFVYFSGDALTAGVESYQIEGVTVSVYTPAKTVADCFKYRNKVGLDVAIEALREGRRLGKCTDRDLWHFARICRVANVMKPYLEATA
ncbi:MAG TPA: type IV toxin-antitoxin system AbiEi family antitoxin domain-containing protein [Caldilineaceae bacterium]|nr:type IV toxin-antitoxin system AbiEi family antitoxin domain-containing protein [Caldilineaceae bacterium]